MADRDLDVHIQPLPPQFEVAAEEDIAWAVVAHEDRDASITLAVGQDLVNGGPDGCEAEAACQDHNIGAFRFLDRPAFAERSPDADRVTGCEFCYGSADKPNIPDGVNESAVLGWIAAHADSDFTHAKD